MSMTRSASSQQWKPKARRCFQGLGERSHWMLSVPLNKNTNSPAGGKLAMEIGLIVARRFSAMGEVVPSELPAGRAAHFSMKGPFDQLPLAWPMLFDWCKAEKLTPAGINWEIYGTATEDAELYVLLA